MSTPDHPQFRVGDEVEFDVPEVEGIGPGYTARGTIWSATPGNLLIIEAETRDSYPTTHTYWRRPEEVRRT